MQYFRHPHRRRNAVTTVMRSSTPTEDNKTILRKSLSVLSFFFACLSVDTSEVDNIVIDVMNTTVLMAGKAGQSN